MSVDARIDVFFEPISNFISSFVFFAIPITDTLEIKFILIWLAGAAIFFTFYLNFVNFRCFRHAIDLVRGKGEPKSKKKAEGQISKFQALTTSLSGTVGLGNIAGVAVAVSVGGPGAVFWMIVMGFFAMSSKFAEVMLAVKYRVHNDPKSKDKISGGPMYYLEEAFKKRGMPRAGVAIAYIFAFACVCGAIGGGNMFQANQAYSQVAHVMGGAEGVLGDKGWLFGFMLAFLVGMVIIGGIKSIANVASKLVPVMGGLYLFAGVIVVAMHYTNIPGAIVTILQDAFSMEAGIGGLMGGLLVGVQRAAFSNEAGLGSAAIVHATAETNDPVSQGMVGMLGPFIDTVVICTVTALVIVVTGVYEGADGVGGVELTSQALASGISWFPEVLAIVVFLFAYSTIITWSYYGTKCATFLFGQTDTVEKTFKVIFCGFIVIGAAVELKHLIGFSDAMILAMAFPNIVGLFLFAPEIKKDVKAYLKKAKL